ncbi:dipeptidase [Leucobacter albus]|uniref:Dipeptidase n=1 Tax=Leucobacter albus TaxID=272210 RepID=A0ABW3TRS8_9MICO
MQNELAAGSHQQLHDESIVFDASMVAELSDDHIDRMRRGGVTAINHTVCTPYATTREALSQIGAARRWIDAHPDELVLALTVDDVRRAKAESRQAVLFGPQDTEMIGADIGLLNTFYDLGTRFLQLTYQRQNLIGAGCGENEDSGLTHFGREFVREMNALGIVVDVSHCGERTGLDAMSSSSTPVVVTHSFAHELSPHIRAKTDDFVRALAAQGGVMGITTLSGFLYYPDDKTRRPDLKRFAEHVAHVAEVGGVESVAVATDYEETLYREEYESSAVAAMVGVRSFDDRRAIGMEDGSRFPNITQALLQQGFSPEEIKLILGENWMRVLKEVC